MKPILTEEGFEAAAQELNCDVPAIKAVCDVEAPKGGFLPDGRPTILFERHKFYKYTGGKKSPFLAQSDICNPKPGGYGPAGAHQWSRFSRAFALDPHAAMLSCSWGKFQIMGFNFAAAGFETLDAFVAAMKVSEDEQLRAFVKIVKAFGLAGKLRRHDWAAFALGYNGENYEINQYDKKLARQYAIRSRELRPSSVGSSVAADVEKIEIAEAPLPEPEETHEPKPEPAAGSGESVQATITTQKTGESETKKIEMTQTSPTVKKITLGLVISAVVGAIQQAWAASQETVLTGAQLALKHLPLILLIIAFAGLAIWLYNKEQDRKAKRLEKIIETNSDKTKADVVIT